MIKELKISLHKEIKDFMFKELYNHRKRKEGLISVQNQLIADIDRFLQDWEESEDTYLTWKYKLTNPSKLKPSKSEVEAMIDYSNIEIGKLIDEIAIERNQSAIHHWVDQFYKILKGNCKRLNPSDNNDFIKDCSLKELKEQSDYLKRCCEDEDFRKREVDRMIVENNPVIKS